MDLVNILDIKQKYEKAAKETEMMLTFASAAREKKVTMRFVLKILTNLIQITTPFLYKKACFSSFLFFFQHCTVSHFGRDSGERNKVVFYNVDLDF